MLYNWAASLFPPGMGLGLIVKTDNNGGLVWDLFQIRLGRVERFIGVENLFVYIPSIDGPFVVTPLNWFMTFSWYNYLLKKTTLGQVRDPKPQVFFIALEANYHFQLKKRRRDEVNEDNSEGSRVVKRRRVQSIEPQQQQLFSWGIEDVPKPVFNGEGEDGISSSSINGEVLSSLLLEYIAVGKWRCFGDKVKQRGLEKQLSFSTITTEMFGDAREGCFFNYRGNNWRCTFQRMDARYLMGSGRLSQISLPCRHEANVVELSGNLGCLDNSKAAPFV